MGGLNLEIGVEVEWDFPRQHFIERHSHGINIGSTIDCLASNLFRRHIAESSDGSIGASQSRTILHLGDAEVHHFDDACLVQHQVSGFEIAMDDSLPMRRFDSEEDLLAEVNG
jgi:hypothetical protein